MAKNPFSYCAYSASSVLGLCLFTNFCNLEVLSFLFIGTADLNAGNFDDVPTVDGLRQILKERKSQEDLDKDPWKNLKDRTIAINSEYGRNSVFTLSDTPFKIAWSTDNMLQYLYNFSKSTDVLIANFDSTGTKA